MPPRQKCVVREWNQAVEREEIVKALEVNRWNNTETAEAMGISR